ncbi:MAG: hypothetical protein ACYCUG_11420, partial [Acidimicrobiales bacterium]
RRAYAAAYAHACSTSAGSVISPEKLDAAQQAGPPGWRSSSIWSRLRIPIDFVQPFRSIPYTDSDVFVHL